MKKKRIYLDYASTTPVDPGVLRAMLPYFGASFGNAGSVHSFGQEGIAALDRARETLARLLGASFREIVFTGGATEANNLALLGAVTAWKAEHSGTPRIIISAIEHDSVELAARGLEEAGAEVIRIGADPKRGLDLAALKEAVDPRTAVVSVMYVNNETGEVLPVREAARIVRDFKIKSGSNYPLFHTDAAQAFSYLGSRPAELGADLVTFSAHKAYGPKGVGALYIKEAKGGKPLIRAVSRGGGQEFGLRSGTENIPLIAGFAEAFALADRMRKKEHARVGGLSRLFLGELRKNFPKIEPNSPEKLSAVDIYEGVSRAPHILNIYVPYLPGEELLTALDMGGVAVSHGSACAARSLDPSRVLLAEGRSEERARRSIRVSFGRATSPREVKEAVKAVSSILKKYA